MLRWASGGSAAWRAAPEALPMGPWSFLVPSWPPEAGVPLPQVPSAGLRSRGPGHSRRRSATEGTAPACGAAATAGPRILGAEDTQEKEMKQVHTVTLCCPLLVALLPISPSRFLGGKSHRPHTPPLLLPLLGGC